MKKSSKLVDTTRPPPLQLFVIFLRWRDTAEERKYFKIYNNGKTKKKQECDWCLSMIVKEEEEEEKN